MDGRLIGSAAVAVIDNVLAELEDRGVITSNIKGIARVAAAVGGFLAAPMLAGRSRDIAEGAALAALPLAGHTVREYVKQALKYSRPIVRYTPPPLPQPQQPAPAPATRLTGW